MDKISFFILNVFLNSLFAFFTVFLLIECLIFLCRIRQGRIAATMRMIPIFKLPLDLFLYDFSRWSYMQGINPLNCEEGTRMLSVVCGYNFDFDWFHLPINSSIQLNVLGNFTFTIADLIGHSIHPLVLKVFAIIFICITAGFIIRKFIHSYHSQTVLDALAQGSTPLERKYNNTILSSQMRKYGVQIRTSPTLIGSPFIAGLISSTVYVPMGLSKNLSKKEYEAVLAHEMEHARYKDNLLRLVLDFIGNIFWWVPTKWLRHRIEEGQEIGCDLKCKVYGVDSLVLVSALCKSTRYSIHNPNPIFGHHLTRHTIFKRVNILMEPISNRFKKARIILTSLAISIAFLVIFLGKFWMF